MGFGFAVVEGITVFGDIVESSLRISDIAFNVRVISVAIDNKIEKTFSTVSTLVEL